MILRLIGGTVFVVGAHITHSEIGFTATIGIIVIILGLLMLNGIKIWRKNPL